MKLLLAEDTRDMNRALSTILERNGYIVDPVYDGEEATEHLMRDSYDLVILDIMMPKKDGLQVLRELREEHILVPVLLLTAKAEVDDRVYGLDAGADDYLTKPFAMQELLARVRALTRRRVSYEKKELVFGDTFLDGENFEMRAQNSVRLSIKEFELMQALMMNAGRELDTEWLLQHVWEKEAGAGENTVWLYISYLRGKLRSINSRVVIGGEKGGSFRLEAGA